ncbi:hypothetical protein GE09DRAFT_1065027 [Coniochaeta sp. 2T2.1]|nr:hypothetical protein GE09DRAFT_1065027 [Coniochaeta sp. 2T2.1]
MSSVQQKWRLPRPSVPQNYRKMVLDAYEVPLPYNLVAAFSTWILLAGSQQSAAIISIASVCCATGLLGICYLWLRFRHNYVWLIGSLILNTVVFFEDEHGGLASIMRILAYWVWFTAAGGYRPHLPRLLIFYRNGAINVEEEIAFEILRNFNHERTLAFKDLKSAWKRCFRSITTIAQDVTEFPLQRLLLEPEEVQHDRVGRQGSLNARHFQRTFSAACAHFAQAWDKPVNLLDASRAAHPFPEDMPYHVEQLMGAVAKTTAGVQNYASLVARALMLDYSAPDIHSLFPHTPEEIFDHFYLPFLSNIQEKLSVRYLVPLVRSEFIKLAVACLGEGQELAEPAHVPQQLVPGSCLACLACTPSYTLTCGHRLCDNCAINAPQRCPLPLCATVNETSICPKPAAAGVRILRLGGSIQDAHKIAGQLKEIRSRLFGHIRYSFDLVLGTGVGKFFAFMLFCTSANPAVADYRRPPDILSLPIDELAYQEKDRFWRGSRVDIFTKLPEVCDRESFTFLADRWLALLFYVELDEDLIFYAGSPVVVRLAVKCRIPPGGVMNSLVRTLHEDGAQIFYRTDSDARQSRLLCPRWVWRDVRDYGGRPPAMKNLAVKNLRVVWSSVALGFSR